MEGFRSARILKRRTPTGVHDFHCWGAEISTFGRAKCQAVERVHWDDALCFAQFFRHLGALSCGEAIKASRDKHRNRQDSYGPQIPHPHEERCHDLSAHGRPGTNNEPDRRSERGPSPPIREAHTLLWHGLRPVRPPTREKNLEGGRVAGTVCHRPKPASTLARLRLKLLFVNL
jgi:hypothetical protein